MIIEHKLNSMCTFADLSDGDVCLHGDGVFMKIGAVHIGNTTSPIMINAIRLRDGKIAKIPYTEIVRKVRAVLTIKDSD